MAHLLRVTPAHSACKHSPTFSAATTAPASNPRKKTAGANGIAPITKASAWIATVATGTGFVGQYSPPVAKIYESLETTPDELLLFFHHIPYTHVLHSGKTVIQHIYDSHYEGAARTRRLRPDFGKR